MKNRNTMVASMWFTTLVDKVRHTRGPSQSALRLPKKNGNFQTLSLHTYFISFPLFLSLSTIPFLFFFFIKTAHVSYNLSCQPCFLLSFTRCSFLSSLVTPFSLFFFSPKMPTLLCSWFGLL